MDVALVMFKADGNRRDFPLRKDRVVVGRKNTCDLRIPLSSVSRQHCEVRISGGVAKLRDLGSSNGTYHNHTRVQESVLSPGDEIVVGPVVFTVVIDGVPERIEPVRTILDAGNAIGSMGSMTGTDGDASSVRTHGDSGSGESAHGGEPASSAMELEASDPIAALEAFDERGEKESPLADEENEESIDANLLPLKDDDTQSAHSRRS